MLGAVSTQLSFRLAHGEQWQYVQDGKTEIVTIINGRVASFQTPYG